MPAGSQMANILERKYLKVGVDQNTMLLGYFNPTEQAPQGFEVEIAREIAFAIFGDRLPTRVQFTPVLTKGRTDLVKDGKVDLVIDAAHGLGLTDLDRQHLAKVALEREQASKRVAHIA